MPTNSASIQDQYLHDLIQSARPFLRDELHTVDRNLPPLLTVLRSAGAGECWHRLGTFLDHLFHVYRILKLWNAPDSVCLFGLFHSVYSNSYHDLAIFDPVTDRETVRGHVGHAAERLVHLFCVVPRHPLIHDDLVFRYDDSELREHLEASESSLRNMEEGLSSKEEGWRKKLEEIVPATGIKTTHIRTGEPVVVPRRVVAVFLLMTIADFADQYYGYQDMLYDNTDGRLEFVGDSNFDTLWPGNGKPGLWMNLISRMAGIYTLLVREEAIFMAETYSATKRHAGKLPKKPSSFRVDNSKELQRCKRVKLLTSQDFNEPFELELVYRELELDRFQTQRDEARYEDIELIIPPVFEHCTKILDPNEQIMARNLYWEVVNDDGSKKEKGEEMLVKCIEKNPFAGEPHVLLSQFYTSRGRFEEGEREAKEGLRVLLEWGCPWDKRVSWEGWVAWARVLLNKAKERTWPHTSWGVITLGLIK